MWLFLTVTIAIASRDEWQITNHGEPSLVVAVNSKALYSVTSSQLLQVIYDNNGFSWIDGNGFLDVAVNEDNGVWTVNAAADICYRGNVSPKNLKGTDWVLISSGMRGISTGRYGLILAHDKHGWLFWRLGLAPSSHQGTAWYLSHGPGVSDISCTTRVCFIIGQNATLFSSGLLQNIDSPTMTHPWISIDLNAVVVAAYGDKRVWKIDVNGVIWEAVNVYDENMIHVNWVRRSYEEGKFKHVSVTDKYSFAVHESGNIYVQTGCRIFDFEENNISNWTHTGTAFMSQPVVSHPISTGVSGKFGNYCIDTLSKRKTYDMPATDASLQGDDPTGTVLSPVFQIRSDMLHFAVGGGSYPNNYVGLIVDNSEVLLASGISRIRTVSGTSIRMSRLWWDVTAYKGKCGQIKLYDLYSGSWGHTLFDDLRSSPPCSNGLSVIITQNHTDNVIDVGEQVVYNITMKGFYTSSLRPLKVEVAFPGNGYSKSFAVVERMNVTWTYCNEVLDWKVDTGPPHINGLSNSMSATFTSLLSDASLEIVVRAYDHEDLRVVYSHTTSMKVRVDFGGEYAQVFKQNLTLKRSVMKTAKLLLREEIMDLKGYAIGDNITLSMNLSHSYNESLHRAYKVTIRVLIPNVVTFVEVTGLKKTLGDIVDIEDSVATVRIREIELLSTRNISFVMRVVGDPHVIGMPGKNYSGEILIDAVYYCLRKDCRNRYGNDSEIVILVLNKFHAFNFQYKGRLKMHTNAGITRLVVGSGSLVFICGRYFENWRRKCFCWNATRGVWYGMSPVLRDVTYYDASRKELYGVSGTGEMVKVYGERFDEFTALSPDDWKETFARSGSFIRAEYKTGNEGDGYTRDVLKYVEYCCT